MTRSAILCTYPGFPRYSRTVLSNSENDKFETRKYSCVFSDKKKIKIASAGEHSFLDFTNLHEETQKDFIDTIEVIDEKLKKLLDQGDFKEVVQMICFSRKSEYAKKTHGEKYEKPYLESLEKVDEILIERLNRIKQYLSGLGNKKELTLQQNEGSLNCKM